MKWFNFHQCNRIFTYSMESISISHLKLFKHNHSHFLSIRAKVCSQSKLTKRKINEYEAIHEESSGNTMKKREKNLFIKWIKAHPRCTFNTMYITIFKISIYLKMQSHFFLSFCYKRKPNCWYYFLTCHWGVCWIFFQIIIQIINVCKL